MFLFISDKEKEAAFPLVKEVPQTLEQFHFLLFLSLSKVYDKEPNYNVP
jgi:hypothetical protein